MTNLAGHDIESLVEAFDAVDDDRPRCFLAYTIKGNGLPLAGHKDNHAGLMSPEQMQVFRDKMGVAEGAEWDRFAGLDIDIGELEGYLQNVAFASRYPRRYTAPRVPVPANLTVGGGSTLSTQEAFGRILNEIARDDGELARHIVTTSPDVTVSTNLGPWVNRRHLFDRRQHDDVFRKENVMSAQTWTKSQQGQHIELGIAENNLFILLASLGLSHSLFGTRLLPVGTLYDPFIARGLDALNYACYQDARFMLVATPSGISLAPEAAPTSRSIRCLSASASPASQPTNLPMPMNSRPLCVGVSNICRTMTAARSICACRHVRSINRCATWTMAWRATCWPAVTG